MVRLTLGVALLLCAMVSAGATDAAALMRSALAASAAERFEIFSEPLRRDLRARRAALRREFSSLGPLEHVGVLREHALGSGVLVQGRAIYAQGLIFLTVGYSSRSQLIEIFEFNRAARPAAPPGSPTRRYYIRPTAGMTIAPLPADASAACEKFPALCAAKDPQTVEFLFVTNRRPLPDEKVSFGGERAADITFGAARVRIPEAHRLGRIELPRSFGFWGYTLYETKTDESQHFVIKSVINLAEGDWGDLIRRKQAREALVFVHGYNTTFEAALYRNAQIIWDLQYDQGLSVLFTWPSRGGVLNYIYDQQSALISRDSFVRVLKKLRNDYAIEKVNVLAHSMGNLIVLDALANEARTAAPLKIAEIIMAAPDVDRDHFNRIAPEVRKVASGMTLYASSADRALVASRSLAGVARAGDVTAEGPIVMPGIDTIDVTAIGSEMLGLNHDVFAATRAIMNDIKTLLSRGIRPPNLRLGDIRPVPEGAPSPRFWRYAR